MKRQILSGLAGLAMVTMALGRTDPSYVNNVVQIFNPPSAPPSIDATSFINNSAFIVNTYNSYLTAPYETANTVNYTNFGVLGALEGFRFDTFHTATALYSSAGTLNNQVGAIINCGGTNDGAFFSTNTSFFSIGGEAECLVWATNIINRGTIEMGVDSLLSMQGQNVSLSGGLLNMEGFESGPGFSVQITAGGTSLSIGQAGMFDYYWGVGQSSKYRPMNDFTSAFPFSPLHWVTNRYYSEMQQELALPLANAYLNATLLGPSNYLWQVVFLQNGSPSMSNNVYFPGESVVEWVWPSTNIITGLSQTNYMYLADNMIGITNLTLSTNGIAPPNTGYRPTYIPTNYSIIVGGPFFFGTPAPPGLPFGIIGPNTNWSTEFTAYAALFQPTTVIVGEVAGQNYTNIPGRIEITADKQLDLRSSRIAGLNYLRLTATNNFTPDANTRILTAVADYNLGVTNGTLTVSNLLAPTCPRPEGYVEIFSTRWTNIETVISGTATNTLTNTYFVTMVDSELASSSPSLVQNLTLHATNVFISDVLNVLSNITIDAYNVTITTNGPGAQTPTGQLNFPSGNALGTNAFPRLRTLTNYGVISVQNAAFFGAAASPIWDFVNYGSVVTLGYSVWTTNFVDTGLVDAGPGPINLTANSASLNNGLFNAPYNDIVLNVGSLLISNQVLNAGHNLTIWATNSLTDGGAANGSVWLSGVLGFNLPFEPPIASLLGTTITDAAPAFDAVNSMWAGKDLGPVAVGYSNNAALGRLILDGGTPGSSFVFNAPTGTNALYVDYLEFRDNMTNFDGSGNLANLQFGPGMKIYYAQLIINGVSFAEKLNHKNTNNWNGFGLNWVAAYAGAFSSTNLVYPDGSTNQLNLALVQSCDLDSNGNGIANCHDPAPLLVSSQVGLSAALTNGTPRSVVLSWNSTPFATNFVFVKSSVMATNWQPLTNRFFTNSSVYTNSSAGRTGVVDALGAGSRYYRVRVDAAMP